MYARATPNTESWKLPSGDQSKMRGLKDISEGFSRSCFASSYTQQATPHLSLRGGPLLHRRQTKRTGKGHNYKCSWFAQHSPDFRPRVGLNSKGLIKFCLTDETLLNADGCYRQAPYLVIALGQHCFRQALYFAAHPCSHHANELHILMTDGR